MVRFFKVNDPYRLLAVLVFLLLTRVGMLLLENPYVLLAQESQQMGLAVNSGDLLPTGEYSNAGPLYIYFYALLTYLTTDTLVVSVLLSAVFVMAQAFVLNTVLIRLAAFDENTYLPAFLYAVLLSASPEYYTVGPEMMAITFVLIGLNFLLTHLKYRGTEENIISTGFLFGIAALCAKPAFLGVLFILLVYVLYSNTLSRRYFLMAFGFLLPFILGWLYFFWNDAGANFWSSYFGEMIHFSSRNLVAHEQLLIWIGLPVFIALIAAAQHFTGVGMTNNQIQVQRSMLWLAVFGVIYYMISANGSFGELIWLMPSIVYFSTLWINTVQRAWMAELLTQFFFLGGLYMALAPVIDASLSVLDLSGLLP